VRITAQDELVERIRDLEQERDLYRSLYRTQEENCEFLKSLCERWRLRCHQLEDDFGLNVETAK
jgi:hypothetical protein